MRSLVEDKDSVRVAQSLDTERYLGAKQQSINKLTRKVTQGS